MCDEAHVRTIVIYWPFDIIRPWYVRWCYCSDKQRGFEIVKSLRNNLSWIWVIQSERDALPMGWIGSLNDASPIYLLRLYHERIWIENDRELRCWYTVLSHSLHLFLSLSHSMIKFHYKTCYTFTKYRWNI